VGPADAKAACQQLQIQHQWFQQWNSSSSSRVCSRVLEARKKGEIHTLTLWGACHRFVCVFSPGSQWVQLSDSSRSSNSTNVAFSRCRVLVGWGSPVFGSLWVLGALVFGFVRGHCIFRTVAASQQSQGCDVAARHVEATAVFVQRGAVAVLFREQGNAPILVWPCLVAVPRRGQEVALRVHSLGYG
jgi:hypothetical protein